MLPQGSTSRIHLSLLHAVKIPFYDLTFLHQHRKTNGAVLSNRLDPIGDFPTHATHDHLDATGKGRNSQSRASSYNGHAVRERPPITDPV
jgi:hypothetical protein